MENEKHTKEEIRQHREERVKERMAENRRVTSLSEAQHDALEYLCSVRHEMHSGQKAFFLSDDPRHERFELLIGQGGKGAINTVLLNAGLPTVSLDTEIFKAETDKCFKREDYRSDSDYEMAESFRRLSEGKGIQAHDMILLRHEWLELGLMNRYGYDYDTAHRITERKYNYDVALTKWQKERGV